MAKKAYDVGTMKKIFVLHGWTYSTDAWQKLSAALFRLDIECALFPIPGLTEPTTHPWTLDDYVSWLGEKLDREPGKVVLMGHSNGGRIALAFALRHPEKIGLLVLLDSAGIRHNGPFIRLKRSAFKAVARVGKRLTASPFLRRLLYRAAGERDYRDASPHMRETMKGLIEIDLTPRLPEIAVPTVIIWGRRDRATPLGDGMTMHAMIKASTLHVIEKAAHSPQITHPGEVADILCREIKRHGNL